METYELVLLAAALAGFLTLLQVILAARQDHAAAAAGKIAKIDALQIQIDEKRRIIADIEEELRKRREAIQSIAEIGAEVDALSRKLEELQIEWNQKEQRREEVRALRKEIETAMAERHAAAAELSDTQSKLKEAQDTLDRADSLTAQINDLEDQRHQLEVVIEALRRDVRDLEDAEREAGRLDSRKRLLEVQILSAEQELERLKSELEAARDSSGGTSGGPAPPGEDETDAETRLAELKTPPPVLQTLSSWPLWQPDEEIEALERVSGWLDNLGLEYHKRVQFAFHTAMKSNETTQMAVLAGISGTGKSQLPRQYAAAMGIGFLQVPVQPRWDSPQDLMGFYNYIEGRFRPTDMVRALYQMDAVNNPDTSLGDRMLLVLLDEMNLARVEYYFSDFLSRLESRPAFDRVKDAGQRKDAEVELEIPMPAGCQTPRIFPGYNLLFAGTMNEDESTQSLSDKVVDRANVLRFAAPKAVIRRTAGEPLQDYRALPLSRFRKWVRPIGLVERDQRVIEGIDRMSVIMKSFKRPFGHRLGRAIMAYAANYPEIQGADRTTVALADQVEMRLLPKLRGIEVDLADAALDDLRRFVEEHLHDHTLGEAINDAVEAARGGTGQFVWPGVTR